MDEALFRGVCYCVETHLFFHVFYVLSLSFMLRSFSRYLTPVFLAVLFFFSAFPSVEAATCTFVGTIGIGSWNTGTDWSCGIVPTTADDAILPALPS